MSNNDKPIANPMVVLREEFDDWAVLFDPDTGKAFGLNPVSVFIWKFLDGKHVVKDVLAQVCEKCNNVPDEVEDHIKNFIDELAEQGLVGYETQKV